MSLWGSLVFWVTGHFTVNGDLRGPLALHKGSSRAGRPQVRGPSKWHPPALQGSAGDLSPAALEKRRRRKQERDRKKRKRKELRAKEKAADAARTSAAAEPTPEAAPAEAQGQPGLLFNKVRARTWPLSERWGLRGWLCTAG